MIPAARLKIEALREAAGAAPLTEVQRARVEVLIRDGLTDEEAYDLRMNLLRYTSAEQAIRDVLG